MGATRARRSDVRLFDSINRTFGSNTNIGVGMNTVAVDSLNEASGAPGSAGNGAWRPRRSGFYTLSAGIHIAQPPSNRRIITQIWQDGSERYRLSDQEVTPHPHQAGGSITAFVEAGRFIQFVLFVVGGDITSIGGAALTYFVITGHGSERID